MSDIAIRVENLNKIFRIYDRPGDRLKEAFAFGREKYHVDFQALRELTFEVGKGEFLGIVGKNGAGKSTLLKVLSRELTPTSGSVYIDGKVSLLQIGVGFDPELTGIENVRFASKLLGYSDPEIDGMLKEIIAFAEIGDFIHHPVKTYSSGMYSRLSFAVGININPDILIADEVLSVGDMRFSQKCLRKMREFKERGKTCIFVSHDVQSVNVFCDTAMWIRDGQIFQHGEAKQVSTAFQNYMLYDKLPGEGGVPDAEPGEAEETPGALPESPLETPPEEEEIEWVDLAGVPSVGDGRAEITRMAFYNAATRESARNIRGNEEVVLILEIDVQVTMQDPQVGFVVYNQKGLAALHSNNDICGIPVATVAHKRRVRAVFRMRLPALANGNYIFSVGIQTGLEMAHKIDDVYEFVVARGDVKATQCGYSIIENEKFELQIVD